MFKLLIYTLLSFPLFSVEVILKNGDAFICDVVEENERILKVKWKEKIYNIPKSEILTRDNKKTGTHKGYALANIIMLDGSIVKGNIAPVQIYLIQ